MSTKKPMNRRGFITRLLVGAGAVAVDPERLLWTPGAKLISIPSSNVLLQSYINPFLRITAARMDQHMIEYMRSLSSPFNSPYPKQYLEGKVGRYAEFDIFSEKESNLVSKNG